MARTNNLSNFLTDIAEAIRTKKNTTDKIYASNFDTEIINLPSGGTDTELEASFLAMIDTTQGKNITKLPKGITSIRNYAFYYSTNVKITELPERVTSIGSYAFQNSGLSEIKIPSSVSSLGNTSIFRNCSSLRKIDNYCAGNIGSYAFSGSRNLETLIMRTTTPPTLTATSITVTKIADKTGYIYVPDESIDLYKSATNWSTYASQIKGISELPA